MAECVSHLSDASKRYQQHAIEQKPGVHQETAWELGQKISDGFADILPHLMEFLKTDGFPEKK